MFPSKLLLALWKADKQMVCHVLLNLKHFLTHITFESLHLFSSGVDRLLVEGRLLISPTEMH